MGSPYGHTWVSKEKCDSEDDQIGPWESIYSFDPNSPITPENVNQFIRDGVEGGHYDAKEYSPENGYVVIKRCWEFDAKRCQQIDKDITAGDRYPEKFSSTKYCTTEAIGFLERHGIEPPASKGNVRVGLKNMMIANPKSLAENMSRNNGHETKGVAK